MSPFRSNRVHPRGCRCRGCKRRRKQDEIDEKNVRRMSLSLLLAVILIGAFV